MMVTIVMAFRSGLINPTALHSCIASAYHIGILVVCLLHSWEVYTVEQINYTRQAQEVVVSLLIHSEGGSTCNRWIYYPLH